MFKKEPNPLGISVVLFLLLTMGLFSCGGGGGPTDPGGGDNQPEAQGNIGSSGGNVVVSDQSSPLLGVRVDFSPGAIETTTLVTIGLPDVQPPAPLGADRVSQTVALGPDGIEFNQPVFITIPYDDTNLEDESKLGIYTYLNGQWQWVGISSRDTEANTLTVRIMHFSDYEVQDPEPEFHGFASDLTGDPDFGVMAAHVDGDYVLLHTETNEMGDIVSLKGAMFYDAEGHSCYVELDENGLPGMAFIDDYIIVFGNYTFSTVDLAVISPDGTTEYIYGADWSEYAELWPGKFGQHAGQRSAQGWIAETAWWGTWIVGAGSCVFAANYVACGTALIDLGVKAYSNFDPDISDKWDDFKTVICISGLDYSSCISLAVNKAAVALEQHLQEKQNKQQQINEASNNVGYGQSGGICPTFIQPPPGRSMIQQRIMDDQESGLVANIQVPSDGCLLRSDIPIYGVAYGEGFREFRVEYGEGKNPSEWQLLHESSEPIESSPDFTDLSWMQGDLDLRGNLATWNTGLKNWEHLPWHPEDDPIDFNGVYTIRLVVKGENGEIVEDRVTCEVGNVIAQCLPGTVMSTDRKVTMLFPEQAIPGPFRVYTVKPINTEVPAIPSGLELIGSIYSFREAGDRFMKPVTLRFELSNNIGDKEIDTIGLHFYNTERDTWEALSSTIDPYANSLEAVIYGLPDSTAYFAALASTDNTMLSRYPEPEPEVTLASNTVYGPVLCFDTFENNMGEWSSRDREFGALITRNNEVTPDGSFCLKIINDSFGGNFACTVHSTPFSADHYPLVSFDYRIPPDVRIDIYIRSGGTWYNLGLTDDENNFQYNDVGMCRLGAIEGIIADDEWHSTYFDLEHLLSRVTGRRLIEEIVFADWNVSGYMKLDFGYNSAGSTFYIDNFMIQEPNETRITNRGQELIVDSFSTGNGRNLLGGTIGQFSNPGSQNFLMNMVSIRGNPALSLIYNVSDPNAYAGVYSQLEGITISQYDRLLMMVKESSDSPCFTIGLKNNSAEVKVPAERFLGSYEASGWRELAIPLVAFGNVGDMQSMDNLTISFANDCGCDQGELLLDDIRFEQDLNDIAIADFEGPEPSTNRLNQQSDTFSSGAAAITSTIDRINPEGNSGHCLRVSYGGSIGLDLGGGQFSYAGWFTGLGGVNASGTSTLTFNIKGQSGGESLNVYLDDGNRRRMVDIEEFHRVTTEWHQVIIPLHEFERKGIDLTHLVGLQFVIEWQEMSGTVYLDDLRLISR